LGGFSQYSVSLFKASNGDLQIHDADTGSLTTIKDFGTTSVGNLVAGNYTGLSAAEINQVINDMAAYATTNSVNFNSLSDVQNNSNLMNIIANAFHY
jgi:hypothetical protein